jgi:MFS transporter, CP family, cyanate transporter
MTTRPRGSGQRVPAMPRRPRSGRHRADSAMAVLVAGIVILALNLRAAITSLPPVFPELSQALHLSTASLSVLALIPVLCFAVFSLPAAWAGRRFGEERVLFAALELLAGGLLLRAVAPGAMLFPGTALAGVAIALMNVLLPSLVKRRHPERAGLLIGTYLLTLSAGQVISTLIAVPVFRAAADGGAGSSGWAVRLTLGIWALPAAVAAAAWLPQVRRGRRRVAAPLFTPARRRILLHRQALAWQVAAFLGLAGVLFYTPLSWLPTLLQARGMSAAGAGEVLSVMTAGNAVSALAIPALAHRTRSQRLLAAGTAATIAIGLSGTLFAPVGLAAGVAFLLGLGQGAGLGLGTFLMVAGPPDPAAAPGP